MGSFGVEEVGNEGLGGMENFDFLSFSKSNGFLLRLNPWNKGYGGINDVGIKLIFSDLMQKMKIWEDGGIVFDEKGRLEV